MTLPANVSMRRFLLLSLIPIIALGACVPPDSTPHNDSTDSASINHDQTAEERPYLPIAPERGYYKGFSAILPPDGDFETAYARASEHAEFVSTWVGASDSGYWDLAEYLSGWWGSTFVEGFTRGNGMFPILNLSFIDRDASGRLTLSQPPGASYTGLSDPAFRETYRDAAVAAVRAVRPAYVSLGNEVNRWHSAFGESSDGSNDFEHFVTLYEETYAAVKEACPETVVFCVFAREIVSEGRKADMSVLGLFKPSTLDAVVFTSYPFAVSGVSVPSDLPDDYYSAAVRAAGLADKPFGFTELGWSTMEAFGGESAQAQFLADVVGRLSVEQSLQLSLLGWWSLFDLEGDVHGTGLIAADGREKPAFALWESL